MASETVENYLKAIMTLAAESPNREATISRIAAVVGVTRGTATSMVKKLGAAKLVKAERYGGVMLTARGSRAAADVLRRHRLIETFLVRTLKFDWSEVHEEAERLEHAVSPRLLARLDEFLGYPESDPHGDPIPGPAGALLESSGKPLSACAAGTETRVIRVIDQSAEFLRFMADHGLVPDARVTVVAVHPAAQSIEVEPRGRARLVLAFAAAKKIIVDVPPRRAADGARRIEARE